MTKNKEKQLLNLVNSKNVIFVDCFDTILTRECKPIAVLDRWFYIIAEKYNVNPQIIKEIWKASTHLIVGEIEELSFKKVALNMYNRLLYLAEIQSFDQFYEFILNTYIQIERSVICVNKRFCDFLRKMHIKKKIYLVSDFYMPIEFFKKLFHKLKIDEIFDDMFISSEIGYRKSSGTLYSWLLKKLEINSESVVMIGDNKISDYKRPKEKNIEAFNIMPFCPNPKEKNTYRLWNIFEEQIENAPLSNYSFSLYLFIIKLYDYVIKNNVKKIYFCSREGEFFKKIFDSFLIQKGINGKIKTYYLLVSRKSTFLPSLNQEIKKEDFKTLKNTTNNLSIREFILTLGLVIEDFSSYYNYDLDRKINDFFDSAEFNSLINDKLFSERYKTAVIHERLEFSKYLESVDINKDTKEIVLVDIGWRGTIQDNIYNYFDGHMKINGLYYGLEGASNLNLNNKKYGLVYSDVPTKSVYFDIFSTNHRMLERILQASHGTANCYQEGKCILSEIDAKEHELYNLMKNNKSCIINTIQILDDFFEKNEYSILQREKIVAYLHESYLLCYTKKNYVEECDSTELMLMTFGTGNQKIPYMNFLKSIVKMSKIEKFNKGFKIMRRVHCNLMCDILVKIVYRYRKNHFYKMEI